MSSKRRRLSPAPSGEEVSDQIPDFMIEEILLRLPFSSVFGFRRVSRPWLSLTTSRYFIQRRELRRAAFPQDPPLALLLQDSNKCTQRDLFHFSGVPQIKLSGFSLDFLPGFRLGGNDPITVMGSCEDLLLCCNREHFQSDYFVVNPITRQWVALPPTLRLHKYVLAGFVCEPASIAEARKGGELRYRVVRIPVCGGSETEVNVEIFSSEDRQWNEYVMTKEEGLGRCWWNKRGVACNGILYWQFKFGRVRVMKLDPFNPSKKGICIIENAPPRWDEKPEESILGMCGGKLRMSEVLRSENRKDEALRMNIWEMENGEAKWQLVQVVPMGEILAANSSILPTWVAARSSSMTLAFHPSDPDIIYFYIRSARMSKVICCNLKRNLEIVSGYDLRKSFGHIDAFPIPLPWWPTPVPALPPKMRI